MKIDVVLTEEIWQDPQVQSVLAVRKAEIERMSCTIRGLSGVRNIYRIQPI